MGVGAVSGDILLLLSDPKAARLLGDMLARGRRVLVAESDESLASQFALGVVDGPALHRSWRSIAERKRADSPAFLPFLLVTRLQDVPLFARFLWTAVDELIQIPIQTPELLARVDVLLRARDASLRVLDPAITRFQAAFENDLTARWIAAADGRLLVVNARFAEHLGLDSPDDARHRTWSDFIPDLDARREFLEKLAAGSPVPPTAVELRTQAGTGTPAIVTAVPFETGGTREVHGTIAAQSAAVPPRELLAERLESIAKLAGGIGHNVNNALSTVLGYADLLLTDLAMDDPRRADVEEIRQAALQSAEVTRQLLAFSRRQVLRPTELRLGDVVLGMERTLRAMLRDDLALTLSVAAEAAPVLADRSQLERVLLNLVLNARDAAAGIPDGEVCIETRSQWLAAADRSRVEFEIPAGEYAVLVVRDNGRGVSAEVRSRAFEPFFTTKQGADVLGLGLSTVYGIVKQSGGFVWLDSEPGMGTTATVYLPAAPARTAAATAFSTISLVEEAVTAPTVLLADDEESVRTMAARILRQKGYTVVEAPDGDAALVVLREYTGRVDLLLTDVALPGVDGRELAGHAGVLRPGVPVVFLSGDAERDILERGMHSSSLLTKPFRAGELVTAVRKAIENPKPAKT
jgi:signal transduction histidine kinase/CheY-like chemotaxis protein